MLNDRTLKAYEQLCVFNNLRMGEEPTPPTTPGVREPQMLIAVGGTAGELLHTLLAIEGTITDLERQLRRLQRL